MDDYLLKNTTNRKVRKWYRSPHNRKIMGVCQGLAEYFRIRVTLIRVAFIISALFGGWGVVLYVILSLARGYSPTNENSSNAILSIQIDQNKGKNLKTKRSFMQKMIDFVLVIVLSTTVYFPMLILFMITGILVIISFVYPLLSIKNYYLSLPDLGINGWIVGITLFVFVCLGTYLLFSWFIVFHLRRDQQTRKKQFGKRIVLFFCILSFNISSILIITWSFFYVDLEKTWKVKNVSNINWERWQKHINQLGIPTEKITFVTYEEKTISICYTLTANALEKNDLIIFLQDVELDLSIQSKPKWKKYFSITKRFIPKLQVTVFLPSGQELDLPETRGKLDIRGTFMRINIDARSVDLWLANCKVDTLVLNAISTNVKMENCAGNELAIISNESTLFLDQTHFHISKIHCQYGSIQGKHMTGEIQVQNFDNQLYFENVYFFDNSGIHSSKSRNTIIFFRNIPEFIIEQTQSNVRDDLTAIKDKSRKVKMKLEKSNVVLKQLLPK